MKNIALPGVSRAIVPPTPLVKPRMPSVRSKSWKQPHAELYACGRVLLKLAICILHWTHHHTLLAGSTGGSAGRARLLLSCRLACHDSTTAASHQVIARLGAMCCDDQTGMCRTLGGSVRRARGTICGEMLCVPSQVQKATAES